MTPTIHGRFVWYRDDHGAQRFVRVESTDPAELDRVEAFYRRLEARSRNGDIAWRAAHATFTDLEVEPGRVAASVVTPDGQKGFPWEGPRFEFAILYGEGPTWPGPAARVEVRGEEGEGVYGVEVARRGECPACPPGEMPVIGCCLMCCRSGRDLAIPRPTAIDLRKREEKAAEPTRLPEPKKDKAGRELAGGLAGKR